MKKYIPPILMIFLIVLVSCCPEPRELTKEEIDREKQAVVDVIEDYNRAFEDENFSRLVETLADEVIFFGTDSSEIIKTFSEFKRTIKAQWDIYDELDYGDLTDVDIQMDQEATFASIIFGVPCWIIKGDIKQHLYLRVARTLKKQQGRWVIVSGIVGVARSDNTLKDFQENKNNVEVEEQ